MKKYSLNGEWQLSGGNIKTNGTVPGSVYSFLLDEKLMDNPHYRDNELKALELMEYDYIFTKKFKLSGFEKPILCFDGVDTVSQIYLNGVLVGETVNMHRKYEFDISSALKEQNTLELRFPSITKLFHKAYIEENLYFNPNQGVLAGASSFRKSLCMSGWDWGPRLPDMGIWRDVYVKDAATPEISDVEILQRHFDGKVGVTVNFETTIPVETAVEIVSPIGERIVAQNGKEIIIETPLLWWPNGYGEQNLYTVTVTAVQNGSVIDSVEKHIALRTLELVREPDEYGESFYHRVNGVSVFAMGGCYIPEDNIMARITKERTEKLLDDCLFANYNCIRVWGGGHYPNNFFYDLCDQKGLLVFQDMMYACSEVSLRKDFQQDFCDEVEENLKRIRHHACLAIICGNNEMEWWTNRENEFGKAYLDVFERRLPEIVNRVCGYIGYVPSSPSSKGGFFEPNNENYGDCHYWDVWIENKPFSDYRNHYFRYLSEFGFESLPDIKTIESFTLPKDRNLFSRIMERHQRNVGGNQKIISYLSDTYKYPTSLETLVYASQLLQADAMKYAVEHLRANRGRCMGALYWQLNDIWPVSSWSSIDYYGRYKALHYFAKRFFGKIMVCCAETGEHTTRNAVILQDDLFPYETKAKLFVCNETVNTVSGELKWSLRNSKGEILQSGSKGLTVAALGVASLDELNFNKTDVLNNYIEYSFIVNGKIVSSGTSLFTVPKYFNFINPELSYKTDGNTITVSATAFAKSVCISSDSDVILSDNYFDLNADTKTVTVLAGELKNVKITSVYDI